MRRRNPIPRNRNEAQARQDSYAVVTRMRREGLRLKPTAKLEGIDPEIVRYWVGSALRKKRPRGDYYAKPYDRVPLEVRFLTPKGRMWITVRDSRTRSRIGRYMSLVGIFARTGKVEGLEAFRGLTFQAGGQTYTFVTDPAVIAELESADELQIEGLYREVGAAR